MDSLLIALGLGIAAFALTNIDDMLMLIGFFADPKFSPWQVVAGQYAGILTLYGISVTAALVALVIPVSCVGLLGLAPLLIGAVKLWALLRGQDDAPDSPEPSGPLRAYGRATTVALVTIANGGDNVASYTPLFATHGAAAVALIGGVFAVLTGLWCAAAHWLVDHRALGAPIRRYGRAVLPFVLIGLALAIFWKTDVLALFAAA